MVDFPSDDSPEGQGVFGCAAWRAIRPVGAVALSATRGLMPSAELSPALRTALSPGLRVPFCSSPKRQQNAPECVDLFRPCGAGTQSMSAKPRAHAGGNILARLRRSIRPNDLSCD